MADTLDAELSIFWKRVYAQCQQIAQQEARRLFGPTLLGGKLNGGAIGGAGSLQQSVITPAPVGTQVLTTQVVDGQTVTRWAPAGLATNTPPLGGDAVIPSAFLATPVGVIDEQGRWSRSPSNPVLTASVTWEGTAVVEPTVLYEHNIWKMWYRGGWSTTAIGYATSPDGITWSKYAGNPVVGQGGSGIAGDAQQPSVIKVGGTYFMFYAETDLHVATSPDGMAWTSRGTALTAAAVGVSQVANSTQILDANGLWHMLVEGLYGGVWNIFGATSPDGLTWTLANSGNPLTTLQVHTSGAFGGPQLLPYPINGLYHCYYHAVAASALLPTDLYHATSPDLLTWTILAPNPVLTHLGGGSFEHDQVADPCPLEVNGLSSLYYDGDNNGTSTAAIGVATFAGTLHELVNKSASTAGGTTTVEHNGTGVASEPAINFIDGANVLLTVADNVGAGRVDVTIASTGTAYLPLVNGDTPGPALMADAWGQCIAVPL